MQQSYELVIQQNIENHPSEPNISIGINKKFEI